MKHCDHEQEEIYVERMKEQWEVDADFSKKFLFL